MQHAFNFTLEKMICLEKHNNNIKVVFFFYILRKKMRFFSHSVKNNHMSFSFCFDTELMICGGVDFSLYY